MSKHRVLHFLWSGELGGAERAVYQVVREELRRDEWDVAVAFGQAHGPWAETLASLGCEVVDLRMRSTIDLPRALSSVAHLRSFDIHHFHVLEPAHLLASARCEDATRVFTQRHGAHQGQEPLRKRTRRSLGRALMRRYVHAVAGNTAHATAYAVQRYRLQHLPSRVTYNGIDFSLLTPQRTRAQVREELGVRPETIVVGSSGVLKAWKRFERVVRLMDTLPDIQVVLVGDGPVRGSLESQAETLKARERQRITGMVGNVADYLQAIDIFVLPSTADESFGNSVVEAMALGLPSIVFSDSPGLCEHMQKGATGFIVDDERELAELVRRLTTDPTLRAQVGEAGAQYVRSAYTLAHMHESYRDLYHSALSYRGMS